MKQKDYSFFQKFELKRWLSIRAGNPFLRKTNPIDVVDDKNLFILEDGEYVNSMLNISDNEYYTFYKK